MLTFQVHDEHISMSTWPTPTYIAKLIVSTFCNVPAYLAIRWLQKGQPTKTAPVQCAPAEVLVKSRYACLSPWHGTALAIPHWLFFSNESRRTLLIQRLLISFTFPGHKGSDLSTCKVGGFYWCPGATVARCPSGCHQWLPPVQEAAESRPECWKVCLPNH